MKLIGVRLLIFATVAIICATWLCYDTVIDGNQYVACFGAVLALVGGKEIMTFKNLQNGDKKNG